MKRNHNVISLRVSQQGYQAYTQNDELAKRFRYQARHLLDNLADVADEYDPIHARVLELRSKMKQHARSLARLREEAEALETVLSSRALADVLPDAGAELDESGSS